MLDENQLFDTRCNLEMVDLEPIVEREDSVFLRSIIEKHVKLTGSRYAQRILNDFEEMLPMFVKVFPIDYKKALERIRTTHTKEAEALTITEEVY